MAFCCLLVSEAALADPIEVAWDGVDDPSVVGYRIYGSGDLGAGLSPSNFIVEVSAVTGRNRQLIELIPEWNFLYVTSIDRNGSESAPSSFARLHAGGSDDPGAGGCFLNSLNPPQHPEM